MFKNHVTIAFKRLRAQKLHSAINIAGLAVGMAVCILIGLFVVHELSFDAHFPNAERIYRVSPDFYESGENAGWAHPAANVQPAAAALAAEFPEIEQAARIWGQRVRLSRADGAAFHEDGFRWADQSFFDIFELAWLQGDPEQALARPFTVVLTETTARRYFGIEDPLGQTLLLEDTWPIEVTGVIEDLPGNTHLSADAIASIDSGFAVLGYDYPDNWSFRYFHTYVRLAPGARIEAIERRLPDLVERHRRADSTMRGMTATNVTDIHLRSRRTGELKPPGSLPTVYAFGAIALSVLMIACVNFTNLSTASASQRAREVGMRKVLGSDRFGIMRQFLGEAVLFAAIATVLAVALVELLLPPFNSFVDRQLTLDYLGDVRVLAGLVGFMVVVGLAAGSYPAFYLSALEPARVLKAGPGVNAGGSPLRNVLVAAQFAAAVTLMIVTGVIVAQMSFARGIERGFDTAEVVVVSPIDELTDDRWRTFKQELLRIPGVTHVAAGSLYPAALGEWPVRAEGAPERRQMHAMWIGYDFLETYGIELLAGRTFDEARGTDGFVLPTDTRPVSTAGYVLNERAALELGWTAEQALDKWLELDFSSDFTRAARGPIIGVVRDTHVESLRSEIRATAYAVPPAVWPGAGPTFSHASIRLIESNLAGTLEHIEVKWHELLPEVPLSRRFASQDFELLYRSELRQLYAFLTSALLAILIACVGLFGLAAYMTERRHKEIGIRKAAGGTAGGIVLLLTKDFLKPVLLANLVAWPLAWLIAQRWLEGFAYRIDLGPQYFVGGALLAVAIAAATVGATAARAATRTPIHSLRHE